MRQERRMRIGVVLLILGAVLFAESATAYDALDPNNCNGAEWDDTLNPIVSRVSAQPRVNCIKSPYDDDFRAETCPAATIACRKNSYLVTGDLVLVGRTRGEFACVTYQSRRDKKPIFTTGWLPSSALTPVPPTPAPQIKDWIGVWDQHYGSIEIKRGGVGGKLQIDGEMAVAGAEDVHNGVIKAQAMPDKDSITFQDDGSVP